MKTLLLISLTLMLNSLKMSAQNGLEFNSTPKKFYFHTETVWGIEWSSDGKELYSCGGARQAAVLNAENGELLRSTPSLPFENYPKGITINKANTIFSYYIFNAYEKDVVKIHHAQTMKETGSINQFDDVMSIAMSPVEDVLYIAADDGVYAYSSLDGTFKKQVIKASVRAMNISADGKLMAIATTNDAIEIYNLKTMQLMHKMLQNKNVNTLEFSPDGKTLAAGYFENNAKLWDVSNGKLLYTLTGINGSVNTVAFSPDSRHVAIGGMDYQRAFIVFNTGTGATEQIMNMEGNDVMELSFSPDGKNLAVAYRTYGDVFKVATIKIFSVKN